MMFNRAAMILVTIGASLLCMNALANPIIPSFSESYPSISIWAILAIIIIETPFVYIVTKRKLSEVLLITVLINAISSIPGFLPALRLSDAINAYPEFINGGFWGIGSIYDWIKIVVSAILIGTTIEVITITIIKKRLNFFEGFMLLFMNVISNAVIINLKLIIK